MEPSAKTISLQNPDNPVYRIFSVWTFEAVLRLRTMALRSPAVWQDPFEDPARHVIVETIPPKAYMTAMLSQHLPPAFVQCWSKTGASDALLRAYSHVAIDPQSGRNVVPKEEGVQVRSTPRKLRKALKQWVNQQQSFKGFVGDVQYLPERVIMQKIGAQVFDKGTKAFATPELRADLLFVKRDYFSHESEFRIVAVGPMELAGQTEVTIPIDPNELFDEVTFDPRLIRFEMFERWDTAKKNGYMGSLADPSTYVNVLIPAGTKCDLGSD